MKLILKMPLWRKTQEESEAPRISTTRPTLPLHRETGQQPQGPVLSHILAFNRDQKSSTTEISRCKLLVQSKQNG